MFQIIKVITKNHTKKFYSSFFADFEFLIQYSFFHKTSPKPTHKFLTQRN